MGITQLITCMHAGITNGELHRIAPKLCMSIPKLVQKVFLFQYKIFFCSKNCSKLKTGWTVYYKEVTRNGDCTGCTLLRRVSVPGGLLTPKTSLPLGLKSLQKKRTPQPQTSR
ncbi:unnamed protein product [Ixodes persulcatus]